tara:strand:- start:3730 stop:4986 length:1257 start_codon:yes stop_codon:yes gene_type:complete
MSNSKFCKRCLYSNNHPLNLTFDDQGLCSGCQVHDEKNTLDWSLRWNKLESLVSEYRTNDGNYDCIVPVTAGQDSYYIMHIVKNKLGMKPLMVTYNKYFNTPVGIHNLANLRMKFNSDLLIKNVNPISVKKIIKKTLLDFGNIYWANIAGQSVFPVEIAVKYKIPLIIWGAHQGVEQVGMFSHENEVEMTRRYRKTHDLFGYEADDLLTTFDGLNESDIWQYRYPDNQDIRKVGVRGIYLSNYVRWDPLSQHMEMVRKYNYKTANLNRTFDIYDYIDCYNYADVHDLLKLFKHGYSKVTDHVCREIRHNRITRENGKFLIKKYELNPISYQKQFLDYIGMTERGLNFILDYHRNTDYWSNLEHNGWEFSGLSSKWGTNETKQLVSSAPDQKFGKNFQASHAVNLGQNDSYIIIGKGFP